MAEAWRAELRRGGLIVDFGTPDQLKATRGGWKSGWGPPRRVGGTSLADLSRRGRLSLPGGDLAIRSVVVRARALVDGARLGAALDYGDLGRQPLGKEWQVLRFPVDANSQSGGRVLHLSVADQPRGRWAAQVDWVWLRTDAGGDDLPELGRVGRASFGGPRRVLRADPPTSYTFYLAVPKGARLKLAVGSAGEARFTATVRADGGSPLRWQRRLAAGQWQEGELDLSPLAGEVVRLALDTRGSASRAAWAEPTLVLPPSPALPGPVPAASRAQNLIHILVDTARRDAYRAFDARSPVPTPALDRLVRGGTLFSRAYVNGNWTYPSLASMLTGRYVTTLLSHFRADSEDNDRLPDEAVTVAEHLRRHGFETAAFSANFVLSSHFGLHQGWQTLRNLEAERKPLDATDVFGEALAWLRARKDASRRFYLFIQTMDPHLPYRFHRGITERYLPENRRSRALPSFHAADIKKGISDEELQDVRALYHGEIDHHDRAMATFLDGLAELGLLNTSLVVHSTDHGEELKDHGKFDHGHTVFEELVATPLVLHYPPVFAPGSRCAALVEAVDLAATELEVLGVPPLPGSHGESLRRAMAGRPAAAEPTVIVEDAQARALLLGPYKLIHDGIAGTLYHLGRDPGETRDLAKERPIALRACEVYLGEGLGRPAKRGRLQATAGRSPRPRGGAKMVLDPQQKRRLKALGYIE